MVTMVIETSTCNQLSYKTDTINLFTTIMRKNKVHIKKMKNS